MLSRNSLAQKQGGIGRRILSKTPRCDFSVLEVRRLFLDGKAVGDRREQEKGTLADILAWMKMVENSEKSKGAGLQDHMDEERNRRCMESCPQPANK